MRRRAGRLGGSNSSFGYWAFEKAYLIMTMSHRKFWMRNVSNIIWETCKTYLIQQGKFLVILWVLIAACIFYYFSVLQSSPLPNVLVILLCSILGILGSY